MYYIVAIIEKGPQSVSFIERLSSLQRLNNVLHSIEGTQSVLFMERLSSLKRLKMYYIV